MKKQTFTKQAVWQAAAVGVLAVGGVLFCLSGQVGIGQAYRQVRVDDSIIGYAPEKTDMDDIIRQARQELTQKTGERISGEVVWSSEECRKPFQKLLSENELKEAVENILSEKNAEEKQRVYTVAIDVGCTVGMYASSNGTDSCWRSSCSSFSCIASPCFT